MQSDELARALQAGDETAFTAVFNAHADKIYRLARGLLTDEGQAECVVQDTFMRLLTKPHLFDGRADISTWLYRVAYNLSMDMLRRGQKTVAWDGETASLPEPLVLFDWRQLPEASLATADLHEQLDTAVSNLPDKLRAVFILREIEELSIAECAAVLDISPSAVKVRLHRARLQLRETLSAYLAETHSPVRQPS